MTRPSSLTIRLAIVLLALVMIDPAVRADADRIDVDRLTRTFSEDFDALDVTPWGPGSRWIAHTPWNGDFGDAAFADPAGDFPFAVRDGILRIRAQKDEAGRWRSGLLCSADAAGRGFSQQYGYFEMRAKLPDGPGVWPAFWLGTIGGQDVPAAVEIDVVEYYGHAPGAFQSAVHIWGRDKSHRESKHASSVPDQALTSDFNLYGALVTPERITMYLNRKAVWSTPTPPEHKRPLHILLNLALGSGFPIDRTPNPSDMLVDYVRVYALPL